MTVLEVLDYIDKEVEKERYYKEHCLALSKYYAKTDDLENAVRQRAEVVTYSHSIANYLILKHMIMKELDEEASRAYEEMKAND